MDSSRSDRKEQMPVVGGQNAMLDAGRDKLANSPGQSCR